MRRLTIISLLFFLPAASSAQLSHRLSEVSVEARRPLADTGVQKIAIDSAALKDNISLSIADVIGFNSSLFVKTSGRATLSTVAFRGTAPSHTVVEWNGLPINSPSLGMTDFSMIPAYLTDRANLVYGASSLNSTAGALGGMVSLSTSPTDIPEGRSLQYVQGAGSFTTFDEFLRLGYGSDMWRASIKAVCSTSRNDFKFTNTDMMENVYDDDHNIIDRYHPRQRNRNGSYRDVHLLGQLYYNPMGRNRLSLNVWYLNSDREIAAVTTDYSAARKENRSRESTLRAVASWQSIKSSYNIRLDAGYVNSWLTYDYGLPRPGGYINRITASRTRINTFHAKAGADYSPVRNLVLSVSLKSTANHVNTVDRASLTSNAGYDRRRIDTDAALSAKWQPTDRLGLSATLRQDIIGSRWSPLTPAFFADYLIVRPINLTAKASVARNFRAPSLNDLYYIPGGNPNLRNERGYTWDAGLSMLSRIGHTSVSASLTGYDSHIDNWIIWLPANKGFFSPRNLRKVHSYGLEANAAIAFAPFRDATVDLTGSLSHTISVNTGSPVSPADNSIGRQLPYVPKNSASATLLFGWRSWSLSYKWCYYSKRHTMSASDTSLAGSLPSYFMSNVALERRFAFRPVDLSVKLAVNNLFNATYQTIKSHPMPGTNFEMFISITPKL